MTKTPDHTSFSLPEELVPSTEPEAVALPSLARQRVLELLGRSSTTADIEGSPESRMVTLDDIMMALSRCRPLREGQPLARWQKQRRQFLAYVQAEQHYSRDAQGNVLGLKTYRQMARELGASQGVIFKWMGKYAPEVAERIKRPSKPDQPLG